MDRRDFLRQGVAGAAAVGMASMLVSGCEQAPSSSASVAPRLRLQPAASLNLDALTLLCQFQHHGQAWAVHEDLRTGQGALVLASSDGVLELSKYTERVGGHDAPLYAGLGLSEVAMAEADLLADHLLDDGDPDEIAVRDIAPPPASRIRPDAPRPPWTTFVGTAHQDETMPIFPDGRSRAYRAIHHFPELREGERIARREEGVLGGWLPAVHKVVPGGENRWYDLIVFADVNATNRIVQTWHRTVLVEHGQVVKTVYGYSYPEFPPRRSSTSAEDFYRGLIDFASQWQSRLQGFPALQLPDSSWANMAKFAFARELVVRPQGIWPKYGAVDRDYSGNEYDGFQDIFTSSLYANLEWGRFTQAAAVLDNYLGEYTAADGMIEMRGPEVGQFGITLSLLARYLRYTGDAALLRKYLGKIEASAQILVELHEAALALPASDRGYGLLHGWNESDACLYPDPGLWWKPYYANSALAIRGWEDIAGIWSELGGRTELAAQWRSRAQRLRGDLLDSIRANIRHDLNPPYLGPLPGTQQTFREAMLDNPVSSEQLWSHRVYAELLQADVLPEDLAHLVIDCLRAHGGTTLGIVSNIWKPYPQGRDILGFISYGYALQLLRLDRIEEYLLFLYAHRYQAHTRGSWTAGEVAGITGGMPLFCMPAQMTVPLLLRWMLVFEQDDALYLARALPRDWLASGQMIAIHHAPTSWGTTSVRLQCFPGERRIDAEVSLPERSPENVWLSLRVPRANTLQRVLVDGRETRVQGPHNDRVDIAGAVSRKVSVQAFYG